MATIETILAQIDYLPPFPLTVTKVLGLLRDASVTPDAIAEAVKFDQSIASTALRICNSTHYGLRRQVSNLKDAVVYLGLVEMKKIIILSGTRQYFETKCTGYEVEEGELWRHSLATSILAEKLGLLVDRKLCDDLYITGLLHDIGKLVLTEFIQDSVPEMTALMESEDIGFIAAEKRVIGFDHAEIGGKVLTLWKLPEHIAAAVEKHHSKPTQDDTTIDDLIKIANSVALLMGYGTNVDGLASEGYLDIASKYGIGVKAIEQLMSSSLETIKEVESDFYGFDTSI